MHQDPLVSEEIEIAEQFLKVYEKRHVVQAAFWLKINEEYPWQLYIASEEFNDSLLRPIYREISGIIGEIGRPELDQFRIMPIPATDPLARAAAEYLQLYRGRFPTRLRRTVFGGRGIDEAYIYPNPVSVS